MIDKYCKCIDKLNKIYKVLGVISISLVVLFSTLQVASRYVSGFKILGMEELARMMFVWTVAFGFALGVAEKGHPSIDGLISKLKGKVEIGWKFAIEILFMLFFLLIIYFTWQKIDNVMATTQVTPLFKIPMQYLYISLIVGAGGAVLNVIRNIVLIFTETGIVDKEV